MREICAEQITKTIERLCVEANEHLPLDVRTAIQNFRKEEVTKKAILENRL